MGKKVLIVGGVAGGASAAARLRRLDEEAEIVVFERGDYISYANCGLPYYIGGVIRERKKLLVQTPETMKARFNIDIRTQNEVTKIDRAHKRVHVKDLRTGKEYTETYDKLILSPGARPVKPGFPGIDLPSIFTLRDIPDTDRIKEFIEARKPHTAVVVGGGFIGLEMAENLHERGVKVSIVEMAPQVMDALDPEMASIVHNHLRDKGIRLYLGDGVKGFYKSGNESDTDDADAGIVHGTIVELCSGRRIETDLVILAIGVKPDITLAKDAGLKIGDRGGIAVNEYLETSDPDIYAVGDAIEVTDFTTGRTMPVPLAGPANKQARIAADNICGKRRKYTGTQGTAIVKVFDLTVATTGSNEKTLKKLGRPCTGSIIHPLSHAGYYPGSIPMSVKIVFSPDGQLLGAQVIGREGVDKRIDVLATAIRFHGTVYDLQELELAYAPPYSSAKDPVNMAGFVAGNILDGDVSIISYNELGSLDRDNTILLDVREPFECQLGMIEGAINIPLDQLRGRLHELPRDKDIVVYCQVGLRAYLACRILIQHGFTRVKNLTGGWRTYSAVIQDLKAQTQETPGGGPCGDRQEGAGRQEGKSRQEGPSCVAPDTGNSFGALGSGHSGAASPEVVKLDACGLQCPGPIMQTYNAMKDLADGDILEVHASDPGFVNDIGAWCSRTGNTLLGVDQGPREFVARILKGRATPGAGAMPGRETGAGTEGAPAASGDAGDAGGVHERQDKTIIVFSGDLDKAIASFVIANGAAAMGRKVTMFFTFWGLNILRKTRPVPVAKGFMERMFGAMMPRGSTRLGLS
ncbi:MAG TPA: FAD-dependent oxidoreductase, partial [Firmicutes bacterium]|nr:FAD-dependent oxidoreductase [Bacillota bacterium]